MPNPIEVAILITLFFAIILGIIFKDMLEYQVARWNENSQTQYDVEYKTPTITGTYAAMTVFITLVMGLSVSVFGLGLTLGMIVGAVVVIPTALLVWIQLGSMLKLMVIGGSRAIDIESSYDAKEDLEVSASSSRQ
jgi:hypothetical protein